MKNGEGNPSYRKADIDPTLLPELKLSQDQARFLEAALSLRGEGGIPPQDLIKKFVPDLYRNQGLGSSRLNNAMTSLNKKLSQYERNADERIQLKNVGTRNDPRLEFVVTPADKPSHVFFDPFDHPTAKVYPDVTRTDFPPGKPMDGEVVLKEAHEWIVKQAALKKSRLENEADEKRAAMIRDHLPLVKYVVRTMLRNTNDLFFGYDDMVGYGVEGLIHAVDTYDPNRNTKFLTWATFHIRTTIYDVLRQFDPLPKSARSRFKGVEDASMNLAQKSGHWPTNAQVAQELGISKKTVDRALTLGHTVSVSLDEGNGNRDTHSPTYSVASRLADPDREVNPEEYVDDKETLRLLDICLSQLPDRERTILTRYYKEEQSMMDIAKLLGISETRVSQLHKRGLKYMREYFKSEEESP